MTSLLADQFRNDPRVQQAHDLLTEALRDHQAKIVGVRRGSGDRSWIERAQAARGLPLYYPYVGSGIGRDCYVELTDGTILLDFAGGVGVHPGHSLPSLIDVTCDNTVQQGNLQQNREAVELMELLCKTSGFDHCFLSTSGAMACENALKIAFHHRAPRSRVLAFENGFSGRTLALGQITDRPSYREGMPETLVVDRIPFGDLEKLEELLHSHRDQYALMMLELIQGEGGVRTVDPTYLRTLESRLQREGILVIADEVQTFARTSQLFAFQHFGLKPDLVTLGKQAQVCATLFPNKLTPKPGILSQTFISTGVAIRAAKRIIEALLAENFGPDGKNMHLHRYCAEKFASLGLEGPYGCGLMIAFTWDDPLPLLRKLFDAGLLCFIAGADRVRWLPPPVAVDEAAIDTAMEILALCI